MRQTMIAPTALPLRMYLIRFKWFRQSKLTFSSAGSVRGNSVFPYVQTFLLGQSRCQHERSRHSVFDAMWAVSNSVTSNHVLSTKSSGERIWPMMIDWKSKLRQPSRGCRSRKSRWKVRLIFHFYCCWRKIYFQNANYGRNRQELYSLSFFRSFFSHFVFKTRRITTRRMKRIGLQNESVRCFCCGFRDTDVETSSVAMILLFKDLTLSDFKDSDLIIGVTSKQGLSICWPSQWSTIVIRFEFIRDSLRFQVPDFDRFATG